MTKTFGMATRINLNTSNVIRMQSELFKCTSNIQECTKNGHSDDIPADSASSVTRVKHSRRMATRINLNSWNVLRMQSELFKYSSNIQEYTSCPDLKWLSIPVSSGIQSECFECCWKAVRIVRIQSECSLKTLRMSFNISPPRMHLGRFEHDQNNWDGHKYQSEHLGCT